jgi:alkylation response protein AidB-like acyl-CoA dehydrogenase
MLQVCKDPREAVRAFVDESVLPLANQFDEQQTIPRNLIAALGHRGYLGAAIKRRFGGSELDPNATRIVHEEIARGHGSVENLLTVTTMAATAIQRLGSAELKARWLPPIASGDVLAAIALTEPTVGSSLISVATELTEEGNTCRIRGCKRWITLGQAADLFVVLCRAGEGTVAAVVERGTPGLEITPIRNLLGLRANMLAELRFENCEIPKTNLLGRPGRGIPAAIQFALDEGRFATACGSLGLAAASLEIALHHLRPRSDLARHQLVQQLLTAMIVDVRAAQAACAKAVESRTMMAPEMILDTLIAKYVASRAATSVSSNAVQVLGAAGCHGPLHVERYFRDAKIMEIIEGTTQVHEIEIARLSLGRPGDRRGTLE